jgi:hypothetical protein
LLEALAPADGIGYLAGAIFIGYSEFTVGRGRFGHYEAWRDFMHSGRQIYQAAVVFCP